MAKKEEKVENWYEKLESELEKKREEVIKTISTEREKKKELNMNLIEDFWRIWLQFNKINVHFRMDPPHSEWGRFIVFPDKWELREDFDFSSITEIALVDLTRDQNRTGDSIKVTYYATEEGERIKMIFEFFEGEEYYKYSGWKRIYSQYILYEAPVKDADINEIHKILKEVIAYWFESHLRRKRDIILNYIRENYKKGASFTE